ncbi:MAG: hypothetical protein JNJ61_25490 [Anaerolineae bacterium]|nr:hypothetical protein [Anaerolineae bacterium]
MDANGARFHLLYTPEDWGTLIQVDQGLPLVTLWTEREKQLLHQVEWNPTEENLRLRPLPRRFTPPDTRSDTLDTLLERRRGAAYDRHWYWIDDDEQTILFLDRDTTEVRVLWTAAPDVPALDALKLQGLTVTPQHFLVAGVIEPRERRGVLIIDLHRGGPPVLMLWPKPDDFTPWDFAADPDGSLLILSREKKCFWVLDRNLHLPVAEGETITAPATGFQPLKSATDLRFAAPVITAASINGYQLPVEYDPISIEHSGKGTVLILADGVDSAVILHFTRNGEKIGKPLPLFSEEEDGTPEKQLIRALDFAYVECCLTDCGDEDDRCLDGLIGLEQKATPKGATKSPPTRLLYVMDSSSKQVLVYQMKHDPQTGILSAIVPTPNYLRVRRWGGKALVASHGNAFYDFQKAWLPLATLRTAQGTRSDMLDTLLDRRRGAARDRYRHWYWIDDDEQTILFLDRDSTEARVLWTSAPDAQALDALEPPEWAYEPEVMTLLPEPPVPPEQSAGAFRLQDPTTIKRPPLPLRLQGLTVTAQHFLVAGVIEPRERRGLLIIDLHRGRPPVLMLWPKPDDFAPWDFAADPDGSLLILSVEKNRFWVLDHNFQFPVAKGDTITAAATSFQPLTPDDNPRVAAPIINVHSIDGYQLPAEYTKYDPISIEHSGKGTVLVLADGADSAVILHFKRNGEKIGKPLPLFSEEFREEDETTPERVNIHALDFAYVECCLNNCDDEDDPCLDGLINLEQENPPKGEAELPPTRLLYVVDSNGKQVLVYQMKHDLETGILNEIVPTPNYLPMRRWGGKALVASRGNAFYDFQKSWLPLIAFTECFFHQEAQLITPPIFEDVDGQNFDSRIAGCVWHRLLLDADIPVGTQVRVRARASDNADLLPVTAWVQQPHPYLRSAGAEIPFYEHPALRRVRVTEEKSTDTDPRKRLGTWELLFQEVQGRYLQLEITLAGTGRSTPELYALRAWFPRFSYSERYLPPIYNEQPVPASFLERWLANFEGLYTNLEDMIEHLPRLLDPRSAPPDTLDWLGSWMGLVLDPLWTEQQRRMFIRYAHRLYQQRGTLRGLLTVLWLYLEKKPTDAQMQEILARAEQIAFARNVRLQEQFARRQLDGDDIDILSAFAQSVIVTLTPPLTGATLAAAIRDRVDALTPEDEEATNPYLEQPLLGTTLKALALKWATFIEERWRETRFDIEYAPSEGEFTPQQSAAFIVDMQAIDQLLNQLLRAEINTYNRVRDFAHRFSVLISNDLSEDEVEMLDLIIRLEKPAHTSFELRRAWDEFVVGSALLGIDTILSLGIEFDPFILGDTHIPQGYLVFAYPLDVLDRFAPGRDILGGHMPRL